MTAYKPRLVLNRLVIVKDGLVIYDESFHLGVNIIRGTDNSVGKSSIAEFIFFALGGDLGGDRWKEEMRLSDTTFAEVSINGQVATLRRPIEGAAPRRSMSIYWGDYTQASASAATGWEVFPFPAMPGGKESFSQVLFRALEIPQVKGELASRITMHQVLRLLFVDQMTPSNLIFRHDPFDSALLREAVGSLLTGVYDDRLYEIAFEIGRLKSELDALRDQLSAVLAVLSPDQKRPVPKEIAEEIRKRDLERASLLQRLAQPEASVPKKEKPAGAIDQVRQALSQANLQVSAAKERISELEVDIADSELFLRALRDQAAALEESRLVRESFGSLTFAYCPSCFAKLSSDAEKDCCSLCQQHQGDGRDVPHLLRIRHEIAQQLQESELLQAQRREEFDALTARLPLLMRQQHQLQLQYDELRAAAGSSIDEYQLATSRRIGLLDGEILEFERLLMLANRIDSLQTRRDELLITIARLEEEKAQREEAQADTKEQVAYALGTKTAALLRQDLPLEERFKAARYVTFDFGTNTLAVDGHTSFSASSLVVLKNAFHLALLITSTEREAFRYPRFVIFDNIEDKGMRPERSHNFQRLIVEESAKCESEHQIIFTTSMIDPDLEQSDLTVGRLYSPDRKSLELGGVARSVN